MTYDITVPIEQGSPEDRVLKGVPNPQEFIRLLVRRSARPARAKSVCTEADAEAFVEKVSAAELFSGYSDEDLKAMQDSAKRLRNQGLTRRA